MLLLLLLCYHYFTFYILHFKLIITLPYYVRSTVRWHFFIDFKVELWTVREYVLMVNQMIDHFMVRYCIVRYDTVPGTFFFNLNELLSSY